FAAGDLSADEAFREIAAGHVEVTEHAAELARRIEPGDRRAEGVDDALALVMARPALGVRDHGPELRRIERRLGDRHHAAGRPAELRVAVASAGLVPARHRLPEYAFGRVDEPREFGQAFGAAHHTELDLGGVAGAPVEVHLGIVVGRTAQRVALAASLVRDQPARNPAV